jgi:hypothetical protein
MITLMAIGTVSIACMPSYASIGLVATFCFALLMEGHTYFPPEEEAFRRFHRRATYQGGGYDPSTSCHSGAWPGVWNSASRTKSRAFPEAGQAATLSCGGMKRK